LLALILIEIIISPFGILVIHSLDTLLIEEPFWRLLQVRIAIHLKVAHHRPTLRGLIPLNSSVIRNAYGMTVALVRPHKLLKVLVAQHNLDTASHGSLLLLLVLPRLLLVVE